MKNSPEDKIKKKSSIPLPFQCEADADVQIFKYSDEKKNENRGLTTL